MSLLSFAGYTGAGMALGNTAFIKAVQGTALEKAILTGGDVAVSAIIQAIDTGSIPTKLSDWAHFIGTSLAFRIGK